MNEVTFTFTVDEDLSESFIAAAGSHNQTVAQLLRDFMRDFVRTQQKAEEYDGWLRCEVQAGLDAADAGDVISGQEIEAEASAWRDTARQKNDASI